ncbi:hypothetical protein [uncultured Senegalimassilia sp.]|uniref:Uncharacterized protein n=1 Tax=Siphoviridae sp. ctqBc4 TaxID=2827945 RepID=A0A8S5SD48_9CAUD|nr:hypothetical protein [uncultured Senegalimassilia sp.]DAF48607.1 MAG TPA: hypothetical protein [Siphoviridae sp. ctqBc4]
MGVKLMTGATGEQNIEAADDRECLAGITGLDSYVFDTGSKLKATLVDANTVTIGTGAGSMQGSRFRCPTTTTVTIRSGTQGQYRHDIIGLHFSRDASGKESLEFQVLTGEPASSKGATTDPEFAAGDLLKGDAEAFMPLYRVRLSGINAADPEPMFSILTQLATLEDSASHAPRGVVKREAVAVPGFVGGLTVEYCLVGGAMSYDPERVLWLRLSGYSYANNQSASDGPWGLAVKAPSGSTRWCVRIPFKATTGKAGDWSIDTYVMMLGADTGYYLTYVHSTSKRLFSASDGYLYLDMYEDKPDATPIGMWFNTTLPVARP